MAGSASFPDIGALQTHNKNWQSTWEKLEHFPVTDEVVRNLPVRNPLIWI